MRYFWYSALTSGRTVQEDVQSTPTETALADHLRGLGAFLECGAGSFDAGIRIIDSQPTIVSGAPAAKGGR